MPEGWLHLLKSIQQESASSPMQQATVPPGLWQDYMKKSTTSRFSSSRGGKGSSTSSVAFGSNRTASEVDSRDNDDKSLEKNPYYKLKSKKELEEERKKKVQTVKPDNVEKKNEDKTTPKNKESESQKRNIKASNPPEAEYNGSSKVKEKIAIEESSTNRKNSIKTLEHTNKKYYREAIKQRKNLKNLQIYRKRRLESNQPQSKMK